MAGRLTRAACVAVAVTLVLFCPTAVEAQSGRAGLSGWVAFENVAYVDSQPQAVVELRHDPPDSLIVYVVKTDQHGFFDFPRISLGRFTLRIAAPHFQPYAAEVYLSSD